MDVSCKRQGPAAKRMLLMVMLQQLVGRGVSNDLNKGRASQ